MISRFLPFTRQSFTLRQSFATATLHQVNYYNVLGVESGATPQQILKSYNKLLQSVDPTSQRQNFKSLSQAFVILSNNKSRDAYDSLLRARTVSYLNDAEEVRPATKSYLATRREEVNRLIRKTLNIDEFGRFKGGLPTRSTANQGQSRGSSVSRPGTLATRMDIENYADRFPEYNIVDSEVAESFKNYHQKDRRDRTMKEPWFTMEVDYQFFSLQTFRLKYLPWIRWGVVFLFAVPSLWLFIDRHIKLWEQEQIKSGQASNKQH